MAASKVNAQDLLRALVHLAPEQKTTILALARTSKMHLPLFAAAIRKKVGGTLLFDAVMLLRGGSAQVREPGAAAELFEHCINCRRPDCSRTDCLELRGMLSGMKAHAQACDAGMQCLTCQRWHTVRDRMKRARAAHAILPATLTTSKKTGIVAGASQAPPARSGDSSTLGSATGTALLMLARCALSEVPPSSPRLSPVNSPNQSPRSKRPKSVGGAGADQPRNTVPA